MSESWNPLELVNMRGTDIYKDLAIHSTKQQIKNILKSYVGYFDPFCELLQNAMDAVDKRYDLLKEPSYEKRIKIIINIKENSLYVADNGIGFEEVQFKSFLSPNITFKFEGKTRGNKGVGTTYLAYGFNRLNIYTITEQYTKYASIKNGRAWIDDKTNAVEMPLVETIDVKDSMFEFDRGTSFKLYFSDGNGNKTKDLS